MDRFRNLISVRRRESPPAAAPGPTEPVGAFVTAATLVTFPVASAVVLIIWKALGQTPLELFDGRAGIAIAAVLVGLVIYLVSYKAAENLQRQLGEFGIAVINTFILYAAAAGIDVTVLGGTAGG